MTATVELRLPLGYFEMDEQEMEYLEGGATRTVATISAQRCNDIAILLGCGFGIATAVAGVIPGGQIAAAVIAAIGCVGVAYFSLAGNHRGLEIKYTSITRTRGYYWSKIRW